MAQANRFRIGTGTANGTFGELLQGVLPGEDEHFMVTLPVQLYSRARFSPDLESTELTVVPDHKTKSLGLVRAILSHFYVEMGGTLIIESELPEGKGLASSSADMVATATAVSDALQQTLPIDSVLDFLREIEPTDGIMFPNNVLFYHRRVRYESTIGSLPAMKIIAIDEGGTVDTIAYNALLPEISSELKETYRAVLEEIKTAFALSDWQLLGRASTQSAILNQSFHPKMNLDRVMAICEENGGLGVVVTHSGPCIGIMLLVNDPDFSKKAAAVEAAMRRVTPNIMTLDVISDRGVRNLSLQLDSIP